MADEATPSASTSTDTSGGSSGAAAPAQAAVPAAAVAPTTPSSAPAQQPGPAKQFPQRGTPDRSQARALIAQAMAARDGGTVETPKPAAAKPAAATAVAPDEPPDPDEQEAAPAAAPSAPKAADKAPDKPKAPDASKLKDNNPVAILRRKGERLDESRKKAELERTQYEQSRAALEQERAQLAAARETQQRNTSEEMHAAKRLINLARTEPETALSILAELSGQKTDRIIARIAERAANGTTADDAAVKLAEVERRLEARLAEDRAERERANAAAIKRAQEQRDAARENEIISRSKQFSATALGLDPDADPRLRKQAENLPHIAAVAKANPARVERAVARIMKATWEKFPEWEPTHSELNVIAEHLEKEYRSEYEGVSSVLTPRSRASEAAAAPLGEPAVRAPASPTQQQRPNGSAQANGSAARVDIAAAASSGLRAPQSLAERRRLANDLVNQAREIGRR